MKSFSTFFLAVAAILLSCSLDAQIRRPIANLDSKEHLIINNEFNPKLDKDSSSFNLASDKFKINGLGPCDNFTNISCGETLQNQTTVGAGNNIQNYCIQSIFTGPDKVYRINHTGGPIQIVLDMQNGIDLDMFLLKDCTNNPCIFSIGDNIVTGIYREVLDANIGAGTYYLIVDGFNGASGSFDISLDCSCNCTEPYSLSPFASTYFCDDIENYLPATNLTPQGTRWTNFEYTGGGNDEGDAGEVTALPSGNQVAHFRNLSNYEPDVNYWLDDQSSDRWRVSWRMFVANGKQGHFDILHRRSENDVNPQINSNIAYAVDFAADGSATLDVARVGNLVEFTYPTGEWFDVVNIIDMDQDIAELWVDGKFVSSWQFSLGNSIGNAQNLNVLASIAFWAPSNHDFYVDDICFWDRNNVFDCECYNYGKVCIENGKEYVEDVTCCPTYDLYTSDEYGQCYSVCDLGGTFIYRGDTYTGEIDNSDIAPDSIRLEPCVQSAYGNNLPNPLFVDVYAFYNYDGDNVVLNHNSNDPLNKAFIFSCNDPDDDPPPPTKGIDHKQQGPAAGCIDRQICLSFDGDTYVPEPCNDLYYVVVTGPVGSTYTVQVTPSGDCASDPDIITCGQTISDNISSGVGDPFFSSDGQAYLSCYNGQRNYLGNERIYKFILNAPQQVRLKASSTQPLSAFLYSFVCGNSCMEYAENSAVNDTATIVTSLGAGTYYVIIDREDTPGSQDYTLSLDCIPTQNYYTIQADVNDFEQTFITGFTDCPSDSTQQHQIRINPNIYPFQNSHQLSFFGKDISYASPSLTELWGAPIGNKVINLPKDDESDGKKCSFLPGDTINMLIDPTGPGALWTFQTILYFDTVPGINAGAEFKINGISYIDSLVALDPVLFSVDKQVIDVGPNVTNEVFNIQTNNTWNITEEPSVGWLSLSPTTSSGKRTVNLTFTPQNANSYAPRSTVLSIKSGNFQNFVKVRQKGNCPPSTTLSISASSNSICQGDSVTLTANISPAIQDVYEYKWSTGETTPSITKAPSAPTTYSVNINNTNCGIERTSSRNITVNPLPASPSSLGNQTMCANESIPTLSVSSNSNVTVRWYSQATGGNVLETGNSFQPSQAVTRTYYAEATFSNTGCTNPVRTPITLTVYPQPDIFVSNKLCSQDLLTWSMEVQTNGQLQSNVGNVSGNNGIFVVTGIPKGVNAILTSTITATGCSRAITVSGLPCSCPNIPLPSGGADVEACEDTQLPGPYLSVQLSGNLVAEWYDNNGNLVYTGEQYQPGSFGVYNVIARDTISQCTSAAIQVGLIELPKPDLLVAFNASCSDDLTTYSVPVIVVPNDAQFSSSLGNITGQGGSYFVSEIPENVDVELVATLQSSGCSTTILYQGIDCPCPTLAAPISNGDKEICKGDTYPPLTVAVGPDETADWFDDNNQPLANGQGTVSYSPLIPGTYYARRRNLTTGCFSDDQVAVSLIENQVPQFSSVIDSCQLDLQSYFIIVESNANSIIIDPPYPFTFNGTNKYTITDIPIGTQVEIVLVDNSTGCTNSQIIQRNDCDCFVKPAVIIGSANQEICQGDPYPTLSAAVQFAQFETVDWFNTPSGGSPLPNGTGILTYTPTMAGTFYAQARKIDVPFCVSGTRSAIVIEEKTPVQVIAGQDQTVCEGEEIELNGFIIGAIGGRWEASVQGGTFTPNPETISGVVYTPPPGASHVTLTLESTDPPGPCPSVFDEMELTLLQRPEIIVDTSYCSVNFQSYSIEVQLNPANTLLNSSIGSVTMLGNGAFRIENIDINFDVELTAITPGTGCINFVTIPHPSNCNCTIFPDKPVSKGNQLACSDDQTYPLLEVEPVPADIAVDWYDAEIGGTLLESDNEQFAPTVANVYFAESRNRINGCISLSRTPILFTINTSPTVSAGDDIQTCPDQDVVLIASGTNYSYLWSTGETTKSILVPPAGAAYTVTATASNGCTAEDAVTVDVLDAPSANVTETQSISCYGDIDGILRAEGSGGTPGYSYLWSNGFDQPEIQNLGADTYMVTISDTNGCNDVATFTLDQPDSIALVSLMTTPPSQPNAFDGSATIEVSGGVKPHTFIWYYQGGVGTFDTTDNAISTQNNLGVGLHEVIVRDSNGCEIYIPISFILSGTSGIDSDHAIHCYPNPTDNLLHILFELPNPKEVSLFVTDMLGRVVMLTPPQTYPDNSIVNMYTGELADGMYLLHARFNNGELVKRIVISH